MNNKQSAEELHLPAETTSVPAHLTVDPEWDLLTVIEFGSVWDHQPGELQLALEEDERLGFLLRESTGPVIGFMVHEPHDLDPESLESSEVWDGPRFSLPQLGLHAVSVGETLLAVRARYGREEPTNDALYFHLAISTKEEEGGGEAAAGYWLLALEAGDMKAHFGLGYTLFELGRIREAYDHLRIYTELTPFNSWAWCWLGKAAEGMDEPDEARRAYETAIGCERAGGFETDAAGLLGGMDGR